MKIVKSNENPYCGDVEALVEGLGYRLVDYSLDKVKSGWHAIVVIFSPHGTGIDDCSKVHRPLQQRLEVLLDSQDVSMEVSSPGVHRVFKKSYELKAFQGFTVSVWDVTCTDWVTGTLIEYKEDAVVLQNDTVTKTIAFSAIKKAKLID